MSEPRAVATGSYQSPLINHDPIALRSSESRSLDPVATARGSDTKEPTKVGSLNARSWWRFTPWIKQTNRLAQVFSNIRSDHRPHSQVACREVAGQATDVQRGVDRIESVRIIAQSSVRLREKARNDS